MPKSLGCANVRAATCLNVLVCPCFWTEGQAAPPGHHLEADRACCLALLGASREAELFSGLTVVCSRGSPELPSQPCNQSQAPLHSRSSCTRSAAPYPSRHCGSQGCARNLSDRPSTSTDRLVSTSTSCARALGTECRHRSQSATNAATRSRDTAAGPAAAGGHAKCRLKELRTQLKFVVSRITAPKRLVVQAALQTTHL